MSGETKLVINRILRDEPHIGTTMEDSDGLGIVLLVFYTVTFARLIGRPRECLTNFQLT